MITRQLRAFLFIVDSSLLARLDLAPRGVSGPLPQPT
jgi:hypothetical protein